MKTVIVFSVLHIAVLVVLFVKLTVIEDQLASVGQQEMLTDDSYFDQARKGSAETPASALTKTQDDRAYLSQMRRIIREELTAQFANVSNPDPQEFDDATVQPIDPMLSQYQLDLIIQEISDYQSFGQISLNEMDDLEMDIVRLNKTDRREAFSSLAKAINTGSLSVR